jgi:hypothetical protein
MMMKKKKMMNKKIKENKVILKLIKRKKRRKIRKKQLNQMEINFQRTFIQSSVNEKLKFELHVIEITLHFYLMLCSLMSI